MQPQPPVLPNTELRSPMSPSTESATAPGSVAPESGVPGSVMPEPGVPESGVPESDSDMNEAPSRRRPWRWAMVALGWVFVGGLAIQRVLQWAGAFGRWVSMIQAFLPYMLLVAPLVIVMASVLRSWRLLTATVVVTLSFSLFLWGWWFRDAPVAEPGAGSLSVVSSNVLFDNPDIDVALDELLSRDADVIVLSEMTSAHAERLANTDLIGGYPFSADYSGQGGLMVLSKYPVDAHGPNDWQTVESAAITVDSPIGDVRIVASHPPPPVFNPGILAAELDAIGADIAAVDQAALVVGDLNTSWVHPPLRSMMNTGDLYDTMSADGKWWVATWPTDGWRVPFVTLDHVLATDDLAVVDTASFEVTGSDHRALFVEVTPALPR